MPGHDGFLPPRPLSPHERFQCHRCNTAYDVEDTVAYYLHYWTPLLFPPPVRRRYGRRFQPHSLLPANGLLPPTAARMPCTRCRRWAARGGPPSDRACSGVPVPLLHRLSTPLWTTLLQSLHHYSPGIYRAIAGPRWRRSLLTPLLWRTPLGCEWRQAGLWVL